MGQALPPEHAAQVTTALKAAYDNVAWQECTGHSVRDPGAPHRKALTYFTHFKPPQGRPGYLKLDMAVHRQIKQMARFRLSCHSLRVEVGRRDGTAWADRRCRRCSAEHLDTLDCGVDDEKHMIFECQAFEHLRNEVTEFVPGMRTFTPGVRTLLNMANGNVRTFMDGDPLIVMRYISRCMDLLDEMQVQAGSLTG